MDRRENGAWAKIMTLVGKDFRNRENGEIESNLHETILPVTPKGRKQPTVAFESVK